MPAVRWGVQKRSTGNACTPFLRINDYFSNFDLSNCLALSVWKFCSSFFKSSSEPPRSAVALRRGRNSLSLESATEG